MSGIETFNGILFYEYFGIEFGSGFVVFEYFFGGVVFFEFGEEGVGF